MHSSHDDAAKARRDAASLSLGAGADGIPKFHTTNGLNLNTAGCSDKFEHGLRENLSLSEHLSGTERTNISVEWLATPIRVRNTCGLNLSLKMGCSYRPVVVFFSPYRQIPRLYLKFDHRMPHRCSSLLKDTQQYFR